MTRKTAFKIAAVGVCVLALAAAWAGFTLLNGNDDKNTNAAVQTAAGGLSANDVEGISAVKALRDDDELMTSALSALALATDGDDSLSVAKIDGDKVYITGTTASYELDLSGSEPAASKLKREVEGVNNGEFSEEKERLENNAQADEEQAAQEKQEEAEAKAKAVAASTRVRLSDADALEAAGLSAKASEKLWEDLSIWCEKKGLEPESTVKAERLKVTGDKISGKLDATKAIEGGEESRMIVAKWSGTKWSFTIAE